MNEPVNGLKYQNEVTVPVTAALFSWFSMMTMYVLKALKFFASHSALAWAF
jgi:hypothetical protein